MTQTLETIERKYSGADWSLVWFCGSVLFAAVCLDLFIVAALELAAGNQTIEAIPFSMSNPQISEVPIFGQIAGYFLATVIFSFCAIKTRTPEFFKEKLGFEERGEYG
jgi:hypothetical protein